MTGFIVHFVLFVLLLLWLPAHANAIVVFTLAHLKLFFLNETFEQLVEIYCIIIIYNNNSF